MNGTATFGDKWHPRRAFCDAHFNRHATIRDESNDDKRDGGIRNCGRRHIAGLLPADDASAEPPRKVGGRGATTRRRTAAIIPGPIAGASPVGSAATIPHSTAQAIPAIQVEVIAEAALTAEAAM